METFDNQCVRERIRQYTYQNAITIELLANKLDSKKPTIGGKMTGHSEIDVNMICAFLRAFPEISAEWLLRGEGEMLRTDSEKAATTIHVTKGNSNVIGDSNQVNNESDLVKSLLEQNSKLMDIIKDLLNK